MTGQNLDKGETLMIDTKIKNRKISEILLDYALYIVLGAMIVAVIIADPSFISLLSAIIAISYSAGFSGLSAPQDAKISAHIKATSMKILRFIVNSFIYFPT